MYKGSPSSHLEQSQQASGLYSGALRPSLGFNGLWQGYAAQFLFLHQPSPNGCQECLAWSLFSARRALLLQALTVRVFLARRLDTQSTWERTRYSFLYSPCKVPLPPPAFPPAICCAARGHLPLLPDCWHCHGTACPRLWPGWAQ